MTTNTTYGRFACIFAGLGRKLWGTTDVACMNLTNLFVETQPLFAVCILLMHACKNTNHYNCSTAQAGHRRMLLNVLGRLPLTRVTHTLGL
jgi:hypothetical protein